MFTKSQDPKIHRPPIFLYALLTLCLIVGAGAPAAGSPAAGAPAATDSASPERPQQAAEMTQERQLTLPDDTAKALQQRPLIDPAEAPGFVRVSEGRAEKMTVLAADGFEGIFPGSGWQLFSPGASDVNWGRSTFRRSTGSASVWCAQSGSDAPPAGGNVPSNTESWMVAGPFDLSGTTSGELEFDLWLETEAGFDVFFAAASLDGSNFTALGRDQNTIGWQPFTLDLTQWGNLGDLTGDTSVWFAFIYESDGSITREGAYVDDVQLITDVGTGGGGLNLTINQIDAGNCPQVQAIVSVVDDQGSPIPGLSAANFSLEEDGNQQLFTLGTVGTGGSSLAVSLVLDGSSSLSNTDITNIQAASNGFIDLLVAGDRVAVYHFDSNVTLEQDYTTNFNAARAAVNSLDNSGNTALYDAIVEAANHSLSVGGRKALIVMTDGSDTASSASLQGAVNAAQAAGVPVFTIGFGSADSQVLQTLASSTGGTFFQGATSADLQQILALIGQTLNSQLILTWNTSVRDGGTHNVAVRLDFNGNSVSRTAAYSQAGTPCVSSGGPCVAGPNTLCLNNDRFRVAVQWLDFNGNSGLASVASCGTADSGLLYFFEPSNWEMLVKVLDGCGFNNRYWVFFAATTNLGYQMTVTDTLTNAQKTYSNPVGIPSPAVTDTMAFATCP